MIYLVAALAIVAMVVVASGGILQIEASVEGPAMDQQPDQYVIAEWPDDVVAFANAVNVAENSNPVYNNPLDLRPPHWTGQTFGAGIAVFSSLDEGWQRGFYQIFLISNALHGRANASTAGYKPSDTLMDVAVRYTGDDKAAGWAATVAQQLGLSSVDVPMSGVLS